MPAFVNLINEKAMEMRNDTDDHWKSVRGVGPTRGFYFLSNDVVRGVVADGFHRNERSLLGKQCIVDGTRYLEYPGFMCANRPFKVIY